MQTNYYDLKEHTWCNLPHIYMHLDLMQNKRTQCSDIIDIGVYIR